MTVESTTSRVSYVGAGTGPYTVPFYFLEDDDLLVLTVLIADGTETTLALNTDYSVTGAADPDGGTVTLTVSLAATHHLVIVRDPDTLQLTDYTPNDPFPAESHETALDKLTMLAQRTKDEVARSLRVPEGESSAPHIPGSMSRASKFLAFDANGDPIASTGTGADAGLRVDLAAAAGSALVGFTQSGTGAVTRDVQGKLRDYWVSVKDFKNTDETQVAGDGVQNDTTGIQRAIDAVLASGGGTVYFPPGTYIVDGLTLPGTAQGAGNVSLEGAGPVSRLKASASCTIVLDCPEDISRDGSRTLRKLYLDGNSVADVIGLKVSQVLHLYLEAVDVQNCEVGYQLETIQEMLVQGCVARSNGVGWLLKQNTTAVTSSTFIRCAAQSNTKCGFAQVGGGVAATHTINLHSCLIQNNAPVGIYLKNVASVYFTGGVHLESNARTGTNATIDGNVVNKSVLTADNSTFYWDGVEVVESNAGNTLIINLTNASRGILSNVGANGAPPAQVFECDATSRIYWHGHAISNCSGGYVGRWPDGMGGTNQGAYRYSAYGVPIVKPTHEVTNERAASDADGLPTVTASGGAGSLTTVFDATYGLCRRVTFPASAASPPTGPRCNISVFASDTSENLASYVVTCLVRVTAAKSFYVSLNATTYHAVMLPTIQEEWTRLVFAFQGNGGSSQFLLLSANDATAADLYIAKVMTYKVSSGADQAAFSLLSRVISEGLVSISGQGQLELSGRATFDPGSLNDGVGTTTTVTVTGAALGDYAEASFSVALAGITVTAWVSGANTVSVRFQNESGGVLALGSGTLRARVRQAGA